MERSRIVCMVGLLGVLGSAGYGREVVAQGALVIGGASSNFGTRMVHPGFVPDPLDLPVVAGGNLDAANLGLGPGCVGWVTRQPDYIVRLTGRSASLRMYATAEVDTTLLVNTANGAWRCNDDSYGTVNPTVDLPQSGPGQYDIWVGTYHAGAQSHAVLHVTELDYHPGSIVPPPAPVQVVQPVIQVQPPVVVAPGGYQAPPPVVVAPGFAAPPQVVVSAQVAPGMDPQVCLRRSGPFAWNCAGPLPGMACTQIVEPSDPHTWQDNYFCSARELGMRWSNAGPLPGMRCTQITEPADPHTWHDNFLCVPPSVPVVFSWSSAGPIPGLTCTQWLEPSDPHTWHDNFLCWSHVNL